MVGPVKMDKACACSEEHNAATEEAGAREPGTTCRAVVNRPFKRCQVHYRGVTFVRQLPERRRKRRSK
jgi:hypothetical protein